MRCVVQRVSKASVTINQKVHAAIDLGYLVYVGFTDGDDINTVNKMAEKVANLRLFEDDNSKMNLSLREVNGSILAISQFTLYGDTKGNNRPSFTKALHKDLAIPLYDSFIAKLKTFHVTKSGIFGADMIISSDVIGPVTIIIEM